MMARGAALQRRPDARHDGDLQRLVRPRADARPRRDRPLGRGARRPWIDWIHTASDQGALVRDYTKWDNQPASVPAAYEALLRAVQIADTAPRGPTYVNLDAALQEAKIGSLPPLPDVARFRASFGFSVGEAIQ